MNFTDGVVALVVIRGKRNICTNSESVYDLLTDNGISHEISVDASGWTELAHVEELCDEEEFDIFMQ